MTKEHISQGVLTKENEFSLQSSSSVVRVNDRNLRLSYDADDSNSAKDPHFNMPHMHKFHDDTKYSSDTDVDYYMMKSEQRKGQKEGRPSKIEFQMVNQHLREKIRRDRSHHHLQAHYMQPSPRLPYYTPYNRDFRVQQQQPLYNQQQKPTIGNKLVNFFKNNENKENEQKRDEEKSNNGNFYYFDHGENEYLRTTDNTPPLVMDNAAEHVSLVATKFWAEFFGSINVGVTFFIVFFLQLYRFILHSIVRSIIVGFLQMTSDYFLKPILTALFNGAIQPVMLLLRNIFQSLWSTLEPLAQMILGFCIPFIECLRAIRLIDVNVNSKPYERRCYSKDSIDV